MKKPHSFNLEVKTVEAVRKAAKKYKMSSSEYVQIVLDGQIEGEANKNGGIKNEKR